MKRANPPALHWGRTLEFALSLFLVFWAGYEVFHLGDGSGFWVGRFSLKWAATAGLIWLALAALAALAYIFLFNLPQKTEIEVRLLALRSKLARHTRWALLLALQVLFAWFLFYSPWGSLFVGLGIRLVLFACVIAASAWLLGDQARLSDWASVLLAGLVTGAALVLGAAFVKVSHFPFALHWSEGNRLWDYSLAFGAERYRHSGPIFAWIDEVRQTLWGLPFLISNVSIAWVRFWGALLITLPYALLGWVAFRPAKDGRAQWLLAGLWSLVFLNQGPVYTPLVLAAILVALARRKPLWLALPLVYLAGDYAGLSRFSWRFAPAIYTVILTFGDAVLARGKLTGRDWLRVVLMGLAAAWSKGLPVLQGVVVGLLAALSPAASPGAEAPSSLGTATTVETLEGLQQVTQLQPYLWGRLLPNPVYGPGIVLGLAAATLPLIGLLVWLARRGGWQTVLWQRIATLLGLGALLGVGLIASAKIGGGADLHNMDMFLVGLVLLAALAWEGGLAGRLEPLLGRPPALRWLLAAMVFLPALLPLTSGKPLELPEAERTQFVLERIQDQVACARQHGDVLLMDQRQLLTFGQLGDLPLIVDYEKKFVMDKALEGDGAYFEAFERDLASGRFALIVSERQAILYKEGEMEDTLGDGMAEENNAWVKWVTVPLLQHYQSISDYRDLGVEIFLPKDRSFECP
ncbi:MAG: hypothetical protein KIS80_01120 [Anaerolineales bacterium]|nr:hypothetical protein [Anaerolineales bacterium]